MRFQGQPVAPWMKGWPAAAGLLVALTILLIVNLFAYMKLRDHGEAPQADPLLRFLLAIDLLAVLLFSSLVVWLSRQLFRLEEQHQTATAVQEEQEGLLRNQIEELRRLHQTLQAETEERQQIASQLKHFQKMETLGKLVGSAAHEFNNYLTVIVGFSEQLSQQLPPGTMEHMTVTEILKAGERSAELTRGLLGLARGSGHGMRWIDVNRQVEGMRRMLNVLLGKRVRLEVVLEGGLPLVEAVPGQFDQVLLNLAANARDAMPEGGELSVETRALALDASSAGVPPGRYVVLTVADTGCGLNEEARQHMFEPFYTTKEDGTGLGLATVSEIVADSHGYVIADSTLGQGTVFKVYWPAAAGSAEPGTRNPQGETQQVLRSERETMRMEN